MAKIKYTPGGERRGFKRLGEGLRASENRIQEQRQIQIDSMKLAAYRQEKIDGQFISGLSDKHRFEEGVLREKQDLENKARTRQYEAFKKFADTDVARMEGEADELKKKADFWKDFAPKFAANLGKLAQGAYLGQDKIRGQAQWKKIKESGVLDTLTDNTAAANFKLGDKVNFDQWKLDPEEGNALHDKTWGISTTWASRRLAKWFKDNKQLVKSDFEASFTAGTGLSLDELNSNDAYEFSAYLLLDQLGMSPNSEGGKEIMEMAATWGREKTKDIVLNRRADDTSRRVEMAVADLNALDISKSIEVDGEVITGVQQYKSGLERLEHVIRNGTFKGDGGNILGPADTLMNPADVRDKAIKYLIENDKSMTYEKLNAILSLNTADTGKPGDKPVPFSQRHPLRAEALRDAWKKRQKDLSKLSDAKAKGLSLQSSIKIQADIDNEGWKNELTEDGKWVARETPLSIPEWRLQIINKIANDPHLLDTEKAALLRDPRILFNPDAIDLAGYYVVIKRDLMDPNGNSENAIKTWGMLSPEQQKILQTKTDIKIFKELNTLGEINGSGKGGFQGVSTSHLAKFKAIEGTNELGAGKSISQSADFAHAEMDRLWLNKYKELTAGEGGLSPAKAVEQANAYITQLWKEGAGDSDGEYGTGPFARKRGTKGKDNKWVFQAYESADDKKINFVTANTDWSQLPEDGAGSDYGVLKTDTVRSVLSSNGEDIVNYSGDPKELLYHPRFINPKELIRVKNQVENAIKNKVDLTGADFDIPENVMVYADSFNSTRVEVLNALFKKHGFDFRIPADPQVNAAIKADAYGYKVNRRNTQGANFYFNSTASGVLPTNKQIRAHLESGVSTTEYFKKLTGIKWEKQPDGSYQFTDSSGFLLNGGLDLPTDLTPQELISNLGLQSLVYTPVRGKDGVVNVKGRTFVDSIRDVRTQNELKAIKKRDKNKVELPYRLPKGG